MGIVYSLMIALSILSTDLPETVRAGFRSNETKIQLAGKVYEIETSFTYVHPVPGHGVYQYFRTKCGSTIKVQGNSALLLSSDGERTYFDIGGR